ncbi:MAG: hypothetical protein E4G91_07125 [Candidatus Zixiibacteriota bacterium]|nr:MAG: hypothetical protein E4G91_07125 [candidate division Zixibacteria bacterium]
MKRLILLVLTMVGVLVFVAGCTEDKVVKAVGEVPAVPTGVSSITGDRQVEIDWRGNNDRDVTDGYGVYRYTHTVDGVDQYELLGTVLASAGVIYEGDDVRWYSYVDRDVTNGITYYYAVNAYNRYGESELSRIDAMDTPRPEGNAVLRDFHTYPSNAGFDFSRARIVRYDAGDADVFFEYDPDLEAFFLFAGNNEVDIQDYGYTNDLTSVGWGDPGGGEGWSAVGWLELIEHHSYIIWTADDHYATIRIEATNDDPNQLSINIRWAYQTDDGNPELKRGLITRPQHDANYGKRKG